MSKFIQIWDPLDNSSVYSLALYLHHWKRIIGNWPWISYKENVTFKETEIKNKKEKKYRYFWKVIVTELLVSNLMNETLLLDLIDEGESWLDMLLEGNENIQINQIIGTRLLLLHESHRPELQVCDYI